MLVVGLVGVVPSAGAASARQVALQRLAGIHTAAPLSLHGFSVARFPKWRDPDRNGCNAREDALRRTGAHVRRGARCVIRSGVWRDPYTGAVLRRPGIVRVDQLVPLANAWVSGARRWTRAERTQYANDQTVLVVLSRNSDLVKGTLAPDRWQPPRRADWFAYAAQWIRIKAKYRLTVTASERAALLRMLDILPASARRPAVTGPATVGATLTATPGSWRGAPVPALRLQWQRCGTAGCVTIARATGLRYLPVAADAGRRLRVVVTATNRSGRAVAGSALTASVTAAPDASLPPVIAGAAIVGSTLTSTTGTWTGTPPPTLARRWQRCSATSCAAITGATGAAYRLVAADAGKRVQLLVTARNAVGVSTATSAQTATVTTASATPVAPTVATLPAISGTPTVGSTLTTTDGTWGGVPAPALRRQWQRCTTSCANIAGATGTSYRLVAADADHTIQVVVTASNSAGSASATSPETATIAPAVVVGDPTIAAAGDIACDPLSSNFNAGAGTGVNCAMRAVSNLMFGQNFAAVLPLGDTQYFCGGLSDFQTSYDLSWGRLLPLTHPVVGNHEYVTTGGTGCDPSGNASGYFSYFGSRAGTIGQGYYSFDVGSWHLIALNSNCNNVGGCGTTSPQGRWLAADLAAHRNTCTLAYWHIPLFSSGGRAAANTQSIWQQLYAAGVDVVLNGHDHIYERFAPQTPAAIADPARGIREFIVGTGGANHTALETIAANSELRNTNTYGILKLTLHASSYDWQFVPAPGTGTFTDSGSQACH